MVMIGSILLILMSSKGIVIDKLPITNAETKEILGSWYIYVLETLGVLVGAANIALGLDKDTPKQIP